MKSEASSTEDASPAPARAEVGAAGAALHLAFTRGALGDGEAHVVRGRGVRLGRGEPLFPRTPLDDPRISRDHARIERVGEGWALVDLGSRNGTHRNGRRIDGREPLVPGDVIRLGDMLLVFTEAPPWEGEAPPPVPDLVGAGPAIARVRRAIHQVAGHAHSVLVLGETGTGKEVVARAIHTLSGRPGAFVAVNCGAFLESVLDSELFGHARGAFTGAVSSREGLFRAAERGTLFLDELGEMPPALQVKLLRVLETRHVRPLGAVQEIAVDVRVVAATHRDVLAEVRKGRIRADLYARLAQWVIPVPPLRERREDLAPLARHILARAGAAGRPIETSLAEALLLHPWPLNVRGLFNVLSMAAIASEGGRLSLEPQVEQALAAERQLVTAEPPPPAEAAPAEERAKPAAARKRGEPLPAPPELAALLAEERGNVAEVARRLGCSRQQVYRWIEERGLDLPRLRDGASPDD